MLQQMRENEWDFLARRIPLGVVIVIQPALHNCDLDNLAKATLDAAQGVMFEDDRWVDFIIAVRYGSGHDEVRLTVFRLAGDAEEQLS